MKTINYILAMGFSFLSSHGQTLDFTHIEHRPLSWKDVFDGGFHPAWRGNGESVCHQSKVSPILKNGDKEFRLTKGDIQFTIIGDYKMSSVSFYGREGLTEDEANQRILQFANLFKNDDVNVGIIKRKEGRYNFRESAICSGVKFDNSKVIYSFGASGNIEKPLSERVTIGLLSSQTRGVARRVGGKIQPPEGYEHLSLDPRVVNKKYYDDLARRAEEYNRPESQAARETEQPEIARIRPTTPEAPKTRAVSWWIFCAIGATALIILLWLKLRSSKR